MLKPALLPNTRPAVWLSAPTRLAIRAFARAHNCHQVLALEVRVGDSVTEFHACYSADPWFSAQPAHTFDALIVAGETPDHPLDRLILVVRPGPGGSSAMLCVHALEEGAPCADYHINRLLHEATLLADTTQ